MALNLLFLDSFDHVVVGDMAEKWGVSFTTTATFPAGRTGNCLRMANLNNGCTKTLPGNYASFQIGIAVMFETAFSSAQPIAILWDSGTLQCDIRINTAGNLLITRGGTTLETSTSTFSLGAWYYIEFGVIIDNAGSWTVKVNGDNWLNGSDDTQATANAYANQFRLFGNVGGNPINIDDLYVRAGSGALDFWGDCKVIALLPNANGTNSGWTRSAGADDYALLDEVTPNDDTDYISSATATQKTTVNLAASGLTGTVKGIQTLLSAKKNDAGGRTINNVLRTYATDYDDATQHYLGNSYLYHMTIRETNPNTALAWTTAEIDALEAGVKLVA